MATDGEPLALNLLASIIICEIAFWYGSASAIVKIPFPEFAPTFTASKPAVAEGYIPDSVADETYEAQLSASTLLKKSFEAMAVVPVPVALNVNTTSGCAV